METKAQRLKRIWEQFKAEHTDNGRLFLHANILWKWPLGNGRCIYEPTSKREKSRGRIGSRLLKSQQGGP